MFISWVAALSITSIASWYIWEFVYTGEPFHNGLIEQLDFNNIYYALAISISLAIVLTTAVLIISTLKMKMKWLFGNEYILLDSEHSLSVAAYRVAEQFKLKKPMIFLYRTHMATMFSIGSIFKSALAFDEEILKPRQPEEYEWIITRATYINTTMYSWILGLLMSIMWPYFFGRWLIQVSRSLFTNMQHQNHYLILAILFLPFMFLGLILMAIGKLIFLIQHPVQKAVMKKTAAKAEQVASERTRINARQILDSHINDVNFYPGKY